MAIGCKILGKDSSVLSIPARPGAPPHRNHSEESSLLPSDACCCLGPRVGQTDNGLCPAWQRALVTQRVTSVVPEVVDSERLVSLLCPAEPVGRAPGCSADVTCGRSSLARGKWVCLKRKGYILLPTGCGGAAGERGDNAVREGQDPLREGLFVFPDTDFAGMRQWEMLSVSAQFGWGFFLEHPTFQKSQRGGEKGSQYRRREWGRGWGGHGVVGRQCPPVQLRQWRPAGGCGGCEGS